ncbi:MAG: LacI family DNA-binding transcriptional regulator [Bacilli bacterium]
MKKVTIKDIAKETGVSLTTVSLVLNNKTSSISDATIEKVREACKKLNYKWVVPNEKFKNKNTKTIGLIIPEIDDIYYSKIASLIDEYVTEKKYVLFTSLSHNNIDTEIALLRKMVARHVDYLVFLPSNFSIIGDNVNRLFLELDNLPINFVLIDRSVNYKDHVEISTDETYGGYLATSYLISKGYKRIACITGPKNIHSSIERLEGYKKALEENNIPFDESIVFEGDYSFPSALEVSIKLLKRDDFDSIFAFNDVSAYAVYYVADKIGKKVGLDISLVGYDDAKFSSIISPNLTSIRQDFDEMCKLAIKELLSEKTKKKIIKIKPKLIERNSVLINDIEI